MHRLYPTVFGLYHPNMLGMGVEELLVVFTFVLVLFGGEKIPSLMRNVGKGVSELKNGIEEAKRPLMEAMNEANQPRLPDDPDRP